MAGVSHMNELEKNRQIINEADQELTRLFIRRFQAVRGIVRYKMENGLPVLDSSREASLIAARRQELPEELQPYFETWYKDLMAVSRQYQTDIIAAEGTTES